MSQLRLLRTDDWVAVLMIKCQLWRYIHSYPQFHPFHFLGRRGKDGCPRTPKSDSFTSPLNFSVTYNDANGYCNRHYQCQLYKQASILYHLVWTYLIYTGTELANKWAAEFSYAHCNVYRFAYHRFAFWINTPRWSLGPFWTHWESNRPSVIWNHDKNQKLSLRVFCCSRIWIQPPQRDLGFLKRAVYSVITLHSLLYAFSIIENIVVMAINMFLIILNYFCMSLCLSL